MSASAYCLGLKERTVDVAEMKLSRELRNVRFRDFPEICSNSPKVMCQR